MEHRTLSQFASEAEVLETVLNCLIDCTGYGNEYIYDDENDRSILVEDVRTIIEELKAAEELMS
jgi:hypothetical protein